MWCKEKLKSFSGRVFRKKKTAIFPMEPMYVTSDWMFTSGRSATA